MKSLDLHGVSHADVTALCHEFINASWNSESEIHIITGHSLTMKELVKDVLKVYDVEYKVGDLKNSGYIKIWI